MMIADYASPNHGFLQSLDKTESAHIIFKAGKAHEGYFTLEDILSKHYPDDKHWFMYDNATTHLKQADDTLSSKKMPKFSSKHGDKWDGKNWGDGKKPINWGVKTPMIDVDSKLVHGEDGAVLKKKVHMTDGKFADGTTQCLYYPDSHEHVGVFNGMGVILEEQGYVEALKIQAQCPKFQCDKGAN